MLAETVANQVTAYEFGYCLKEMIKTKPVPKKPVSPDWISYWDLNHSQKRHAPQEVTQKKYEEAQRLLKLVIERHPKTPWADLAQRHLEQGLSVDWYEHGHSPKYVERAKLIPKY